jgi:cell division transport system permease protein
MRNWLVSHLHVLLFSLRRLLTTPLSSLLNILVIGIALSLPAGMYLMLKSVQSLAEQTTDTHQISLFLSMDADTNEVTRIGNQLKQHTGINRIKFVPRDQALEQLKQTTGLTDVIGGMAQNPLPDAYIIYPKKTDAQALETLRDELQKWPKVEHVQLDSAWAHKLEAILKFGLLAVILLAVLLGFALIAITFNTIRLQILTRREEIEVSRLIGATNAFIRRPFLYYGLLQGLLGGIAALLIITLSLSLLNNNLAELTHLYASNFKLHLPTASDSATLLLLSAYLGWLGAWLSVSRHLWETESH